MSDVTRKRGRETATSAGQAEQQPRQPIQWSEEAIRKYFDSAPLNPWGRGYEDVFREAGDSDLSFLNKILGRPQDPKTGTLTLSNIIIPGNKTSEGVLIEASSVQWLEVVRFLHANWEEAYSIPPEKWEEILAGAYKRAGFDEVTLTPRSADKGRDVIAIKNGVGCIKVLGSMKRYKPTNLVKHDDVRALLGVLSGEHNASKGILSTTSDFAPKIASDPYIAPFLPTRLELLNGKQLRSWLIDLAKKSDK